MSKTKVTNVSASDFVLPNSVRIPRGETVSVEDWSKVEDHAVVKAWVDGKQLLIGEAAAKKAKGSGGEGEGNGSGEGEGSDKPKTEAELATMKNDEIEALIVKKGGEVKTTWNKAELVKQALELKV